MKPTQILFIFLFINVLSTFVSAETSISCKLSNGDELISVSGPDSVTKNIPFSLNIVRSSSSSVSSSLV